MSYESQWKLNADDGFVSRCRAAITGQALVYKDDGRADVSGLAKSLLKGAPTQEVAFQAILAAAPGFSTTVDNGDGTVDSTKIVDGDILSALQANWPVVASLFYNSDGTPVP